MLLFVLWSAPLICVRFEKLRATSFPYGCLLHLGHANHIKTCKYIWHEASLATNSRLTPGTITVCHRLSVPCRPNSITWWCSASLVMFSIPGCNRDEPNKISLRNNQGCYTLTCMKFERRENTFLANFLCHLCCRKNTKSKNLCCRNSESISFSSCGNDIWQTTSLRITAATWYSWESILSPILKLNKCHNWTHVASAQT